MFLKTGRVFLTCILMGTIAGAIQGQELGEPESSTVQVSWLIPSAKALAADKSKAQERKQQAAYVGALYQRAVSGGQRIDWNDWMPLVVILGKDFSPEVQSAMVRSVKADQFSDSATIQGLSESRILLGMDTFRSLGQPAEAESLCSAWLASTSRKEPLTAATALNISNRLTSDSTSVSAKSIREALSLQVTARIAEDAEYRKTLDGNTWNALAQSLGSSLTAAQKANWSSMIQEAFSRPELSPADSVRLYGALKGMGQKDWNSFLAQWIQKSDSWQKWEPRYQADLAANATSETTPSGGKAVVDYLIRSYLDRPEETKKVGTWGWSSIASRLSSCVDSEIQKQCASKLRAAFQDSAGLKHPDLRNIASALSRLGDPNAKTFAVEWMVRHEDWKAWSTNQLADMTEFLDGKDASSEACRRALLTQVLQKSLVNTEAIRSVSSRSWSNLTQRLKEVCTKETQSMWRTKLRAVYVDCDSLDARAFFNVCSSLKTLGATDVGEFAAAWIGKGRNWEKWTATELVGLANSVPGESESQKGARAKVVGVVDGTWFREAKTIQSIGGAGCQTAATQLKGDLTETQKAQWIQKIRAVAVPDSTLKTVEFLRYTSSLRELGDSETPSLVAQWVSTSEDWKQAKSGDLMALTYRLRGEGELLDAGRQLIAKQISETYLSSEDTVREVGPVRLMEFSALLREALSEEQKTQWAGMLRKAYASEEKIDPGSIRAIHFALRNLGDSTANVYLAQWVNRSAVWQEWSLSDMALLASWIKGKSGVEKSEEKRTAARKLLGYMDSTCLHDPAKIRQVPTSGWQYLAGISQELTPAQKSKWLQNLQTVFGEEKLNSEQLKSLAQALSELGADAKASSHFVEQWMAKNPGWKQWNCDELRSLLRQLQSGESEVVAARKQVADLVMDTYLSNPEAAKRVSGRDAGSIARSMVLRGEFDAKTRVQWVIKIHASMLSDKQTWTRMKMSDMLELTNGLRELGDPQHEELVATWMLSNASWKNEASPQYLRYVIERHLQGDNRPSKEARQVVARHLAESLLPDAEATRKVRMADWEAICKVLSAELTEDVKKFWAQQLRKAFAESDEALRALAPETVQRLCSAIAQLDKNTSGELSRRWLNLKDSWAELDVKLLMGLSQLALSEDAQQRAALLEKLEQSLTRRTLTPQELWLVSMGLANAGYADKGKTWGLRAYQTSLGTPEARAAIDPVDLFLISDRLYELGLTEEGKGYIEFAQAVVGLAEQNKLAEPMERISSRKERHFSGVTYIHHFWGAPLGTDATRQTVQKALLDSNGVPRLEVAKILAWSYLHAKQMDQWRKYLDEQIKATKAPSDALAMWYAAKAFAVSAKKFDPEPRMGLTLLSKAISVASSEACRLALIHELAAYQEDLGGENTVLSLIGSISDQLGTGSQEDLNALKDRLNRSAQAKALEHAAYETRTEVKRIHTILGQLQASLDSARQAGDTAKADQIQAEMDRLRNGESS